MVLSLFEGFLVESGNFPRFLVSLGLFYFVPSFLGNVPSDLLFFFFF